MVNQMFQVTHGFWLVENIGYFTRRRNVAFIETVPDIAVKVQCFTYYKYVYMYPTRVEPKIS